MPTPKKIKTVEQMQNTLSEYNSLIFTNYRGLTVEEITNLRKKLYEKGILYQIVKNKLLGIALKNANIEGLDNYLLGPSAVAFAKDDYVSSSKILSDFAKNSSLELKGGYADSRAVSKSEVEELAKLPSKEVILSKVLACLKSPASGFINVLNGPIRSLVYTLKAISEQKSN